MGCRPVGEVAEVAFTESAVLAVSLAQEDGGRRVPVRDGFDMHGQRRVDLASRYKSKTRDYMATVSMICMGSCQDFCRFDSIGKREARVRRSMVVKNLT
jgi:hypothetical protein